MSKYFKERQTLKNKPRKILSLEERVQALRMFDQTPVYQRVATAFQCSWEQIKNVVLGRDEIMAYYARCQTIKPKDHPNEIRKKKIMFLGNAMFEFIKRALYHGNSGVLDEQMIRERALEFRDVIEIEQFFPNTAWLNDFKRSFNIDFTFTDNIVLSRPPPKSLDCQDIVNYCRNEIEQILRGNIKTFNSFNCNSPSQSVQLETVSTTMKKVDTHIEKNLTGNKNNTLYIHNDNDDDDINENEEGETIDFSQFDENDICDSTKSEPKPKKQKLKIETNQLRHFNNAKENNERTTKTTEATTTQQRPVVVYSFRNVKEERRSCSPKLCSSKPQHCNSSPPRCRSSPIRRYSSPQISKVPIPEQPRATVIRAPSVPKATKSYAKTAVSKFIIPPQIFDHKAALSHLFPLQDYALAEEDFVAINLLEKLAAHYRGDSKKIERAIKTEVVSKDDN